MVWKESLENRARKRIAKISKRNWFFFALMFPILIITLSFFNSIRYLKENKKRLAMFPMAFAFFGAFSSFSFPIFQDESVFEPTFALNGEDQEYTVSLAKTVEINPDDLLLLEDEDVLGDEEIQTSHGEAVGDQYAADEILEYNSELLSKESSNVPLQTNESEIVDASFRADDWRLLLVNKQHSVPEDYTVNLATIKGSMKCDERILESLLSMLKAAKADEIQLLVQSPYRDEERQKILFERKIDRYLDRGLTYLEAFRLSSQTVTVPGYSEHQIGLAIDIACYSYSSLDAGFGETIEGQWLRENCAKFGFILRYPLGKENVTGIEYEPWHFRYVGVEAATIIMEEELTLEEFWDEYL
ncbi:MAG: M15 family metallopeptidase [Lachnospiraceae bacterium]|jgi:D-alanyl-D-alanine carboxypeptidase|nr:M15 family metallopeptidase [Lachnospiraceae bacterium]